MRREFLLGTLGFFAALVLVRDGSGQGLKKSDSEVKVAIAASKIVGDRQALTIQLDINKGWHLYANPIKNDELIRNQTVVTIDSKVKPVAVKVNYPPGKLEKDKFVGDYMIYEGKVTIQAEVQRASGDTGPLEVTIKLNACNDKGQCLAQGTVRQTVP